MEEKKNNEEVKVEVKAVNETIPVKEQVAEVVKETISEESVSEEQEEVVPPPTVQEEELISSEDFDIIQKEIEEQKSLDSEQQKLLLSQIEKLRVATEKLEQQTAKVNEGGRKGYANVPVSQELNSAQPVRKEPKDVYEELSDTERYSLFEKQFLRR